MTTTKKLETYEDIGATWYSGNSEGQPLKTCMDNAKQNKHTFIVAKDYCDGYKTKHFASYNNIKKFYKQTKHIKTGERPFYVIIPEDVEVCLFTDIEWSLTWKSVECVKEIFFKLIYEAMGVCGIEKSTVDIEDFLIGNACEEATNKGSLHIHCPYITFKNIHEQKRFFNYVFLIMSKTEDDLFFYDETDKSFVLKTFIDFGVYNKNRQFRLPYSSKMKADGRLVRPLIPDDKDNFVLSEWCIVDTSNETVSVNVDRLPEDLTCSKRLIFDKKLVQGILDNNNLDVKVSAIKNNLIMLKNKGSVRKCPIGGEDNKSDNAYIVIKNNKLEYYCHNEECRGKHSHIHTFQDEGEILEDEIPMIFFMNDAKKNLVKFYEATEKGKKTIYDKTKYWWTWLTNFITQMNKYACVISGSSKPYVLYRKVIRKKGLEPVVVWAVKDYPNFKLTYEFCQMSVPWSTKPVIFTELWLMHEKHKRKFYEDCIPYENMNDTPDDTFNTYNGLAITKNKAVLKCNTVPLYLQNYLNFIKNSWCNGDDKVFNWVMNWFSHLIQRPWVKMKTSLVLCGSEGAGKGMIIQTLSKIIGGGHFYQPTNTDEMFGGFNYLLDNRLLVFADEMFWGGDKKNTGQLKKLLTETTRTSNCKFLPQRQVSNRINWVFASNEQWVVPAGSRARRYTVLTVNNTLYDIKGDKLKELWDFCPYTFANYLYNRDLTGFNPSECINTGGLRTQKLLTMSPIHKWWVGALEDSNYEWGDLQNKNEMYADFVNSSYGGYKASKQEFWISLNKLNGETFKQVQKTVSHDDMFGNSTNTSRERYVELPAYDEAVRKINKMYDCKIINNVD